MFNTFIRISYDGTNYKGFQVQANASTIQGELERALSVIYKQPVRINGAGRTDAGVHARGQAANYFAPFRIAAEKLPYALNALLPPDIVVTEAVEVSEDFHARFAAGRKIYSYTLDRAVFPRVMKRLYSYHMPDHLDLASIRDAASLFEGTHDFKLFQAAGSSVTDTRRTLYRLKLTEEPEKQLLVFYFEGSGFLYRMVRLMTGSLIRVGLNNLNKADIAEALKGDNPDAAGPSVPAKGLCLERVHYK